ncbi:hypothetical protein DFH27DRAFT_469185, partial [Peziza echinospora]
SIYISIVCLHVHTFVENYNCHEIRHKCNRSHYLPTGRPHFLYHYLPNGVHNYGLIHNPQQFSQLEDKVTSHDVDLFLPMET